MALKDITHTSVPTWTHLSYEGSMHSDLWELARLSYPQDRQRALDSNPVVHISRDGSEKLPPDEHMLCFDYLYYSGVKEVREWERDFSPVWHHVGKHLRFNDPILKIADGYIRRAIGGLSEEDPTPPVRFDVFVS